jgi:hypothetical protein
MSFKNQLIEYSQHLLHSKLQKDKYKYECALFVKDIAKRYPLQKKQTLMINNNTKEEVKEWIKENPLNTVKIPIMTTEYHYFITYYDQVTNNITILSVFGNEKFVYIRELSLEFYIDVIFSIHQLYEHLGKIELEDNEIENLTEYTNQQIVEIFRNYFYSLFDGVFSVYQNYIEMLTGVDILPRLINPYIGDVARKNSDETEMYDIQLSEIIENNWNIIVGQPIIFTANSRSFKKDGKKQSKKRNRTKKKV